MAYFTPSTQLPAPPQDFGITDSFLRARQMERQREAERARILLGQQQLAAETANQKAIREEQSKRIQMEQENHKQANALRQLEIRKAITQAIDTGNIGLAKQLAQAAGLGDVGEREVPRPDKFVEERNPAHIPGLEGPQISPEDARRAAFLRSGLKNPTELQGKFPGMIHPGNIDLTNRPNVQNEDGSVSTVRTMGFRDNNREVLVPTVSEDGRIMGDDEAMDQYLQTGRHLGQFTTPRASDRFAEELHLQQERAIPLAQQAEQERLRFAAAQGPATLSSTVPQPGRKVFDIAGTEYDPEQVREAEAAKRERHLEQFASAFKGVKGVEEYVPVYSAGVRAGEDPKKAFELMQARMKAAEDSQAREAQKQLDREAAMARTKEMAAAIGSRSRADLPQKEAASNLSSAKYFSDEYEKFKKEAGLPQDAKEYRQLKDAITLSKGSNALTQRKAAFNLGRAINGPGVFTDADRKAILGNIAGVLGMAETEVQKLISGEMGDRERAVVEQAVRMQLKEVEKRIVSYDENARQRFGPDSEFADMPNLFENRHKANIAQYGLGADLAPSGSEVLIGSAKAMKNRDKERSKKLLSGGKDPMQRALDLLK